MYKYTIIIEKAEDNYSAYCPGPPRLYCHRLYRRGDGSEDERGYRIPHRRVAGR